MSRLADILQQEYKTKGVFGGTTSALGKGALEKMDIRNALFGGSGVGSVIGTKIFGKGYSATRKGVNSKSPTSPTDESLSSGDSPVLQEINANMKLTAKNSMSLPMMARDMNLMKLNIFKLVKLQGGSANTNKTDVFWKNSKERESAYENTIGKVAGNGVMGKLLKNAFVGEKKRDGQTSDRALFVTNETGETGPGLIDSLLKSLGQSSVISRMVTLTSSILSSPLFLTSAGVLATVALAKKLRDDEIASSPEKYSSVASERAKRERITAGNAGAKNAAEAAAGTSTNDQGQRKVVITKGNADDILKRLIEDKIFGQPQTNMFCSSVIRNATIEDVLETASDSVKNDYLKMIADNTPKPTAPTILPDTGAGGGRGFVNPESVTPSPISQTPSNAVMSASGPIRTSGGFLTSGADTTSPTSVKNPLLDAISKGESASAGGYNAMNQGTPGGGPVIGSGDSQKVIGKKLTDMTVGEVIERGAKPNDNAETRKEKGLIFAAGRYQIIPDTLKGLVNQGIVSIKDKFDEATQDKLGMALIEGTGALKLASAGKFDEAQNALAKTWASIPLATDVGDKRAGQSYYQKAGQNTAHSNLNIKSALMQGSSSTGSALASASTSVADQRMAAMTPTGKGTTVINNSSPVVAAASSGSGSKSTPYPAEFYASLVGNIAL